MSTVEHNRDLSSRILSFENFKFNRNPPPNVGLHDVMVCYFDGGSRKVLPFSLAMTYPIIHDKCVSQEDKVYDVTLATCPWSLASIVLEGKFTATNSVSDSCLVITNGTKTFPIIKEPREKELKRYEVDIKMLRNVFTEYPDCRFLVTNEEFRVATPLLPLDYYKNTEIPFPVQVPPGNIHPKTLVYLIQYISSKDASFKATVLVGRDATATEVTGYNMIKSGVYEYVMKYEDKLKQKLGYVMPLLWFSWKSSLPDAKIIFL